MSFCEMFHRNMLWKLLPPVPSELEEKPVWFSAVSISSHSRPARCLTVATVRACAGGAGRGRRGVDVATSTFIR